MSFGFAHLNDNLLKSETIKLLWTSQKTTDGKETGYGIGWGVGKDSRKRNFVGHSGGSVGGSTILRIYPDNEIVIAVISNMSSVPYGNLHEHIADFFQGFEFPKEIAPSLLAVIKNDGIQEAINYYSYLKNNQRNKYNFGVEQELDRLGKTLLRINQKEEAIEIFKLNVLEFPDSVNVYTSLGDAYDLNKQYIEAKKSYENGIINAEKIKHQSLQALKSKLERTVRKMKRNR